MLYRHRSLSLVMIIIELLGPASLANLFLRQLETEADSVAQEFGFHRYLNMFIKDISSLL